MNTKIVATRDELTEKEVTAFLKFADELEDVYAQLMRLKSTTKDREKISEFLSEELSWLSAAFYNMETQDNGLYLYIKNFIDVFPDQVMFYEMGDISFKKLLQMLEMPIIFIKSNCLNR